MSIFCHTEWKIQVFYQQYFEFPENLLHYDVPFRKLSCCLSRKHEPWQFAHLTTGSMSLVRVVIWKSVSQNRLSLSLFPSITHTLTKIDFLSHSVNDFPRIINDPVLPVNVCESCVSFGEESFSRNKQKKTRQEKVDDGEPGTWDLPDATHSFHHVTVLNTLRESVRSARNVCLCECVCVYYG